jgi:hypothetical protein
MKFEDKLMDEDKWIKTDYLNQSFKQWENDYSFSNDKEKMEMIEDLLSDIVDDSNWNKPKKGKNMKRCNVSMPDANDKIVIDRGCVFIAPTTTGFILYSNPEGAIEVHCFSVIEDVISYLNDNKLLDQTQTTIAENI